MRHHGVRGQFESSRMNRWVKLSFKDPIQIQSYCTMMVVFSELKGVTIKFRGWWVGEWRLARISKTLHQPTCYLPWACLKGIASEVVEWFGNLGARAGSKGDGSDRDGWYWNGEDYHKWLILWMRYVILCRYVTAVCLFAIREPTEEIVPSSI